MCCQGVVRCAARVWSGVLPRCSQTYILGNGLHSLDPKLYRFQPKEKKKCKDIQWARNEAGLTSLFTSVIRVYHVAIGDALLFVAAGCTSCEGFSCFLACSSANTTISLLLEFRCLKKQLWIHWSWNKKIYIWLYDSDTAAGQPAIYLGRPTHELLKSPSYLT